MQHPAARRIASEAELDSDSESVIEEVSTQLYRAEESPAGVVKELLCKRKQYDLLYDMAKDMAAKLQRLQDLVDKMKKGSHRLVRLIALRETSGTTKAVCAANGYCQELLIHPEVSVDELRNLKSWEYVAIHDNVIVGIYKDDQTLLTRAMGDIVVFRGHVDRKRRLIRVSSGGHDRIVQVDSTIDLAQLTPAHSLVIQSDRPELAIALVPAVDARSRFEVPIDQLTTRLEDLAGVEEIADMILRDILLQTRDEAIRNRFGLDPIKGLLLYSAPGMGKTALVRALARFLYDHREQLDADLVLYSIKPNETKSMWHGEDARIVREELFGAIRARQQQPRRRRLIQLVVFDEIDNFGRRNASGQHVYSSAQTEALEALLVELDGLMPSVGGGDGPPAHLLCIGLTNRVDRVDEAIKRPGRFDRVIPMPPVSRQQAEQVMMIYARGSELPWFVDHAVCTNVPEQTVRKHFVRPAIASIYARAIVRYKLESRDVVDVTAGELLTSVHYMDAMNRAKRAAALRAQAQDGIPAITVDDVVDSMVEAAADAARQMEADPQMLVRRLHLQKLITSVKAVPIEQLREHRHLRVHPA